MGPSGYRTKYGSSDAMVIKGVRASFKTSKTSLPLTNPQILKIIGWAITVETATKKVQRHLNGS